MKFTLELVKEVPDIITSSTGKNYPVRVYKSRREDSPGEVCWRWHLGFPREIVEPLCLLLETTLFWGEQHHQEIDGFWVWWLAIATKTDDPPWGQINSRFASKVKSYNHCLSVANKWARQGKDKA